VHGIGIALARMVERGEIMGPRMLAAGNVITMTGGHGHWMGIEATARTRSARRSAAR